MALASVDRFRTVAKILMDARLQEVIEENRKLKLALFWKTYSMAQLRKKIASSIQHRVKCKCRSCNFCGKANEFNGEWDECDVTRRFEQIARDCGLSSAVECWDSGIVPIIDEDLGEEFDDEVQFFCAGDVHIVLPGSFSDWAVLGYGEKLNRAKSIEDPELLKLKKLFETLDEEESQGMTIMASSSSSSSSSCSSSSSSSSSSRSSSSSSSN